MNKDGVQVIPQRIYITAFPKSGTHLMETWVRQLAAPITDKPWLGNVSKNAWGLETVDDDKVIEVFKQYPEGGYLKGHLSHSRDFAKTLWDSGVCTIFMYRDLRDVVVSQSHHIKDERKNKDGSYRLKHPGRDVFGNMSLHDTMKAVITGIGDYAGIIDRWQMYEGWLSEKWVLPVRFEDCINNANATASTVVRYVMGQTGAFYSLKLGVPSDQLDLAVSAMIKASGKQNTTTFRKGKTGEWRNHWTPEIDKAFGDCGGYDVLEKLNYV